MIPFLKCDLIKCQWFYGVAKYCSYINWYIAFFSDENCHYVVIWWFRVNLNHMKQSAWNRWRKFAWTALNEQAISSVATTNNIIWVCCHASKLVIQSNSNQIFKTETTKYDFENEQKKKKNRKILDSLPIVCHKR